MNVGFVMLADSSEAFNGKIYALGAGWNVLRLPLPVSYAFSVCLGLDVAWGETNSRHALGVAFEDPDGKQMGDEFTAEFEQGRPPGSTQGQDQRVVLSLATQQNFETAGPHALVVKIGGQEIGRTRFYVVNTPLPPGVSLA